MPVDGVPRDAGARRWLSTTMERDTPVAFEAKLGGAGVDCIGRGGRGCRVDLPVRRIHVAGDRDSRSGRGDGATHRLAARCRRWFQRWLKIDPDREPWNDAAARRRVRTLGFVELLVIWAIALVVIASL